MEVCSVELPTKLVGRVTENTHTHREEKGRRKGRGRREKVGEGERGERG